MTDVQHGIVDEAPEVEPDRPSRARWLYVGLVVALVALGVLGAWAAYDRNQEPSGATAAPAATAGLASHEVSDLLASRVAAVNNGDKQALMAVYATDAVVEERDQTPPVIYSGNERIATILLGYHSMGWTLAQAGPAIRQGQFVSEPLVWSGGSGIAVYELDARGLIAHQWVIGG